MISSKVSGPKAFGRSWSARVGEAGCSGKSAAIVQTGSWCSRIRQRPRIDRDHARTARPDPRPRPSHDRPARRTLSIFWSERAITYDWTIHDYHSICPRVNLIGSGGRYCGEPDEAACDRCLARLGDDQGRAVSDSISAWRTRSAGRLARCRRVFAPSADVVRRLKRYFPEVDVALRPHEESLPRIESLAAPLRDGEPVRVAVIGTLVSVKGADRLLECARDARSRELPLEFHVIGRTDRRRAALAPGQRARSRGVIAKRKSTSA